jgi:mRNA-degrading endonuclease YafQ of YafQ-DinJ toxin-antitoxin module
VAFTLEPTPHFRWALRRFRDAHPELRRAVARVLRDLETDPHQPRLQLHALKGSLNPYHAVRITYAYRIVLILDSNANEITLIDIDSHDGVYR